MKNIYSYILIGFLASTLYSCTFNPHPVVSPFNAIYTSFGYGLDTSKHLADTLALDLDSVRHVGAHYAWWDADKKKVTVDEAYMHYQAGEFKRWRARRFAQVIDIDAKQYWFYVVVKNKHHDRIEANFTVSADVGNVVGYRLGKDCKWLMVDSVSTHTPRSRKRFSIEFFVDTLTLRANESRTYMFKIEKSIAQNIQVNFVVSPLSFTNYKDIKLHDSQHHFFFGLISFMMILSLLLFAFIGERIYLYQSLYIFFTLWVVAIKFSYDDRWLPDWLFVPLSYLPQFSVTLFACAFITPIFTEFIQPQKFSSKVSKILKWLLWANIVVIALALIQYALTFLLNEAQFDIANRWLSIPTVLFLVIFFWVIFFISIYSLQFVSFKLKIFAIAIATAMVLWYIQTLNQAGVTNSTFILNNNIFLTLIIEISIYTYFILDRFMTEKREKIQLLRTQLELQQALTSSIVEAQESERKRIAQELHDGLGGFLSALRVMVNKRRNFFNEMGSVAPAETLTEVQQKLDNAIRDVRDISHNLMPSDFETDAFDNILKEHIIYLNENGSIIFDYFIDERINGFEKSLLISLYRISLELIRNIQKHSGATKATIQFIVHQDSIQLQVEDNGNGFNESNKKGIGLNSIQSRVQYHKGKLTIDSGKLGTTFIIEIPINNGNS